MPTLFYKYHSLMNWTEGQKCLCLVLFSALKRKGFSPWVSEFKGKRPVGKNQRGYILPALMVFVTVLLVVLTSAEISWQKRMQREREEELIFRGKQYMRAVMLFQRKTGFYPTSVEALLNTNNLRFLRKRWKDKNPITNSEDWRWIRLGPNTPLNSSMSGGTAGFKGASFSGSGGTDPRVAFRDADRSRQFGIKPAGWRFGAFCFRRIWREVGDIFHRGGWDDYVSHYRSSQQKRETIHQDF